MKIPLNGPVGCWVGYAAPCALLAVFSMTGHAPTDGLRLLVWIYGFPSTALLLPVAALFWKPAEMSFVATCLMAAANGGLICAIVALIRNADERVTQSAGTLIDSRLRK